MVSMLVLQARKVCIVELCSSGLFKAAGLEYDPVKLSIVRYKKDVYQSVPKTLNGVPYVWMLLYYKQKLFWKDELELIHS